MSSTMCAEQHKFHTSHHLLSSKKSQNLHMQLDIPPRKLLTRRQDLSSSSSPDYSPRFVDDALLLRNFLPYNNADDEDEDDPYSADHFRMFEFKVRRCPRSRSHDWTDCPFAHPGEKARRRDPRRYHYSGTVCADYRRGGCSRGDSCEFAHGVFECWLHPARYRTEACKDGKNCKRKVCFFAHTPRQLRILPVSNSWSSSPEESAASCCGKKSSNKSYLNNSHCCLLCRSSASSSLTSTLLQAMSSSPMSSYSESKRQLVSSGLDQMHGGMMSYEDVVSELMSSLEAMKFNNNNNMEAAATSSPVSSPMSSYRNNTPWVDVSSYNNAFAEAEQQFILSPSTPSPLSAGSNFFSRRGNGSTRKSLVFDEENKKAATAAGIEGDPDLGWVNDLLM